MDRPDTLYLIFDETDMEVVVGRTGIAYIKPMDVNNEIKRLEYLYPNKKFQLLMYDRF